MAQGAVGGVLVVDDDPGMLAVLDCAFRRIGVSVRKAPDAQAGLAEFNAARPAAVVTDLILPDGDGMSFVHAIKSASPGTPVVVISGGGFFAATDLLRLAASMGADGALAKPFRASDVVDLVSRLLSPYALSAVA
jgi:DNA-binding NtrC family response regulator